MGGRCASVYGENGKIVTVYAADGKYIGGFDYARRGKQDSRPLRHRPWLCTREREEHLRPILYAKNMYETLVDGRHGEAAMAQIVRNPHFLARVHMLRLEAALEVQLMPVVQMIGIAVHMILLLQRLHHGRGTRGGWRRRACGRRCRHGLRASLGVPVGRVIDIVARQAPASTAPAARMLAITPRLSS